MKGKWRPTWLQVGSETAEIEEWVIEVLSMFAMFSPAGKRD